MSTKRRNSSSPECDNIEEENLIDSVIEVDHELEDEEDEIEERPQVINGQSSAFPGLAQRDGDEPFYGPAVDGVDYLRMVRSEARGIPELLSVQDEIRDAGSAPNVRPQRKQEGGGYWYDGAYTAVPVVNTEPSDTLSPAQRRCYEALLAHFALLQATLRCTPPLPSVQRLTSSQPISFPAESKAARKNWEEQILQRNPDPVQLACMDHSSVLQLIKLIHKRLYAFLGTSDIDIVERVGAWIWAAFGKCPERGQLDSDEIAELRQIAQRAHTMSGRLMRYKVSTTTVTNGHDRSESVDEDNDNDENEEGDELKHAGQDFGTKLLNDRSVVAAEITSEKLRILDTIITIVGEVYGQRDLLDLRHKWTVDD